jgi:hypothetical protein
MSRAAVSRLRPPSKFYARSGMLMCNPPFPFPSFAPYFSCIMRSRDGDLCGIARKGGREGGEREERAKEVVKKYEKREEGRGKR